MTRRFASAALLVALALSGARCSGPGAAGTAPFRPEAPPAWTVEGTRIATFNAEFLFDGEGPEGDATFPWKGDPEASRTHRADIARVVRMLDADVVVLVETESLRALELMIEENLADMGYTPHLVEGLDSFTRQNIGLLSRLPVEAAGRTDERVPVGVTDQTYGVSKNLWARLTIGGMPVTLVAAHFLARPDDPERKDRREAQAEVMRRLVEREMTVGREVVMLGDLNDFDADVPDRASSTPISRVLRVIKEAGPGPDDDLRNVLGDVPQAQRFTAAWDRNNDGTVTMDELSALDHLLLSPGLYGRLREVRFVHAHEPLRVSDHFPVVVTLGE
jgi:endonuclease/exonuclease/phosphatase family metal-dependent hydrolase